MHTCTHTQTYTHLTGTCKVHHTYINVTKQTTGNCGSNIFTCRMPLPMLIQHHQNNEDKTSKNKRKIVKIKGKSKNMLQK